MLQHIKNQFKYCPFCGTKDTFIFDTKLFRCSKCGRSYFVNAASACGAIMETPDGIITVRRMFEPKKDMLGFPGGFIDLNEKAEDAIRRELLEEINYAPKDLKFFGTETNNYVYEDMLYTTLDLYFYAVLDYIPNMKASDDAKEIVIIKKDEVDYSLFAFETAKSILKQYLK